MRSIRNTLILGITLAISVVLIGSGIVLYASVHYSIVSQFDQSLLDMASTLASVAEHQTIGLDLGFDDLDMQEFEAPTGRDFLQVWDASGTILYLSSSLGKAKLERVGGMSKAPKCFWLDLPGHRTGRAVGLTYLPRVENEVTEQAYIVASRFEPPLTLVLARDAATVTDAMARLRMLLVMVGLVTIGVSSAAAALIIRKGTRPLDRIAGQISSLGERDLSARLEFPNPPAELMPVIARLNDLLERLDAAFQRERSLSADIAHELRSPLAGLQSTIEVCLTRRRTAPEYEEALADSLRIARQMQAMVENLLSLARLEAGDVQVRREPVDLDSLVQDVWNSLSDTAAARRLRVEWSLAGASRGRASQGCGSQGCGDALMTDPPLLRRAISNIMENAITYADEGGWVKVETSKEGDTATIRVINSGSQVSAEQAEHVFERFWRGDAARGAAGIHCGLGLALVKKIVTALGGSVEARSNVGGTFEVTVSMGT